MTEIYYSKKNQVILSDYMRDLLLQAICKHMDVPRFINSHLELPVEFTRTKGTGPCPWCRTAGTFSVDKKTGRCSCSQCGRKDDLLTLTSEKKNLPLHNTLFYLTGCLQEIDKRRRQERQAPHA